MVIFQLAIAKAVFISSLFTKATLGVILGIILHFTEAIILLDNVAKDPSKISTMGHLFYSFSFSYVSEMSAKTIVALEKMQRGLKWDTLSGRYMGYSINMTIWGSLIWTIIYFLLGIYLE